jgi:DNA-binding CsgD family transcriptional regulator
MNDTTVHLPDTARPPEPRSSQAEDRAAIEKLLADESTAFWGKDYEGFARCWAQEPFVRRTGWWSLGGVTWREGWDEISARLKQQLAETPDTNPTVRSMRRENVNMRIGTDMAWVTYDQHAPDTGDPIFDMPGFSRETKILEKHNGEWKLVYICYLHRAMHQQGVPLIRLDRDGAVMWNNAPAAEILKSGRGLAVRANKLRASGKEADQRLRAAIRWASQLDERLDASAGTLPVVLEGGRGEPARVCWVIADSGLILVAVDAGLGSRRLQRAAAIYGLSPKQVRICEFIIDGDDLPAAARKLGVSINTVRTHLQRLFDKTGVRSQTALVRALLSVTTPTD